MKDNRKNKLISYQISKKKWKPHYVVARVSTLNVHCFVWQVVRNLNEIILKLNLNSWYHENQARV